MMIKEPTIDRNRSKELKVKLPVSQHLKLHSMKVLTGKQINETIQEALSAYFASMAYQTRMDDARAHGPVMVNESAEDDINGT